MLQHGTFLSYFGQDEKLFSFERIRKGEILPPLFVLHGKEDKVAPCGGSERLVELVKSLNPDAKVHLELVDGADHGLDTSWRLENEKLKVGLKLMVEEWLR